MTATPDAPAATRYLWFSEDSGARLDRYDTPMTAEEALARIGRCGSACFTSARIADDEVSYNPGPGHQTYVYVGRRPEEAQ